MPTTGSTIAPAIRDPCSAKALLDRFGVVVRKHKRIARGALGHAGRIGHAERGGRTARRHQQAIDVAVIIAGELHDHRPAGVSAGEADGAHRGLGARIDQPHLLDRRHGLDHKFGQFVLGQRRRAETRAAAQGRFEGFDHRRVIVPEDHRSPRADVIDVAVAVDVEQVCPFGTVEEDRLAADAAERPGGTVHPAGHELFGPVKRTFTSLSRHSFLTIRVSAVILIARTNLRKVGRSGRTTRAWLGATHQNPETARAGRSTAGRSKGLWRFVRGLQNFPTV